MKSILFNTLFLAGLWSATAQQNNNIDDYAGDIPSCAFSAFKNAMKSKDCGVDPFDMDVLDCMCRKLSGIAVAVSGEVDVQCSIDFAQALGTVCGLYAGYGTTATGFAEATSIIGKDLGGSGGDSPSAATSAAKSAATSGAAASSAQSAANSAQSAASSAAAADATASSTNAAALPTYGMAGILGGAVFMARELL